MESHPSSETKSVSEEGWAPSLSRGIDGEKKGWATLVQVAAFLKNEEKWDESVEPENNPF